ncbi:MAG: UDP-3-O-(3-hydroxymyristoyl)glucosamine N-acyltransferase [Planctomycetia bacterium]|nr:UDP-3-O-(3-hydroxymyristoyl)glucosamine N-acyltransferase [Planctomycetia bacterium]
MEYVLAHLADLAGGTVVGDGNIRITDAVPFAERRPGTLAFQEDWKKALDVTVSEVSALLLPKNPRRKNVDLSSCPVPVLLAEEPLSAFAKIVTLFHPPVAPPATGIHPTAILEEGVRVGKDVTIFPHVYVGKNVVLGDRVVLYPHVCLMEECQVGDDSVLFPNVTLYERTVVGRRCILHAGVVLGAYGFGYDSASGEHRLSPQLGQTVLEDDVEIGANSTIDRGTFGTTRIGSGTKLDNLVMVGHNCQIGRRNLLCSQVGIAGSTTTGEYVVMGGQVGVADHITIASRIQIGAQCGVPGSLTEVGTYLGTPAALISDMRHQFVAVKQLPEYWRTLKKIAREYESEKN